MRADTDGRRGGARARGRGGPGPRRGQRRWAVLAAVAAVVAVLVPTVGDVGADDTYPENLPPGASSVPFTPVSWVLTGPPVAGSANPGPTCFGGVYLEFDGETYGQSIPGGNSDSVQVWFQRPATSSVGFGGAPRDPLASLTGAPSVLIPDNFAGSSVPQWFPEFFPHEFSTHAIGIFSRAAVGTVDDGCAGIERQVQDYLGYAQQARMWTFAFVPRNPPTAGFTWDVTDRDTNEVRFTNTSADAQDDRSELRYSWDFGDDEAPSTEQDPVHRYARPGTYTVTLRVTDTDGDVGTTSQQVVFSSGLVVNSTGDLPATDPAARGCDTGSTVGDAPECTLRAAVQAANAAGGGEITFDIDAAGIPTIVAASQLPAVSAGVTIDGTSQPAGFVALRATGDYGLDLSGGTSTVTGLAVAGPTVAVAVTGGSDHEIRGNRLATDPTGTTSAGGIGVGVRSTSGVVVEDNVIGGEIGVSVVASATATHVRGNAIGVTEDGGSTLGDTKGGAVVAGPDTVVEDNRMWGRSVGVGILGASASAATVSGNRIGLTASGAPLADAGYAVRVDGSPGATVSDNALWGGAEATVAVTGTPQYEETPDEVVFLDPSDEVREGAATGGTATVSGNTIGTAGDGDPVNGGIAVWADASAVTLTGNTVLGATQAAVGISGGDGHVVTSNTLGTPAATVGDGIRFADVGDGRVGGAAAGNTIVAEAAGMVLTEGRGAVRVEGNSVTLTQPGPGILTDGATPLVVGNAVTGADLGVSSPDDDARVTGNTVDAGGSGITVEGADAVVQGNTVADQAQVGIASQGDRSSVRLNSVVRSALGLRVAGTDVTVEENLVGITADAVEEGNLGTGIDVAAGSAVLARNRVMGSTGVGVDVDASATAELRGNRIWSSSALTAVRSPGGPPAPRLAAAVRTGSGETLRRTLVVTDLPTGTAGRIEVFANDSCEDPESRYLMDIVRTTGADERARIIQVRETPDRDHFTISYTDAAGSTSELSDCVSGDTYPDADGDGSVDPFDGLLDPAARTDAGRAIVATDTEQLLLVDVAPFDAATGTGGGALEGLAITEDPAPDTHPAGWKLAYGALGFRITGLEPGARTSVSMTTLWGSNPILGDQYWKYGPQAPGGPSSWYAFDPDDATGTGATLTQALDVPGVGIRRAFVLQLADGLRGDADGGANGSITDPGGPVVIEETEQPPTTTTTSTTSTSTSTTTTSTVPAGPTTPGTSASPQPEVAGASVTSSSDGSTAATSTGGAGLAVTGAGTVLWLLIGTVLVALGLAARGAGRVRRREG